MSARRLRWLAALGLACLTVSGCGDSTPKRLRARVTVPAPVTIPNFLGPPAPAPPPRSRAVRRPNIVFVLTDDLSLNLLPFMPHVLAMRRQGLTFTNYFVSDSLCCPSRSSMFTGELPHNTHVFNNFGRDGGFAVFHRRHEEQRTFAVALQRAGYLTALIGKYLNGYLATSAHPADGSPTTLPGTYVPPGWSEWDVAGYGYPEFDYTLNQDGTLHHYGHRPADYLTDVIARLGTHFIDQATASRRPFFLELATFAPHGPYVPAPRDANAFGGLAAPRPPSFDRLPAHAPRWLADHRPLRRGDIAQINDVYRRRAQSVQAVDRLIAVIQDALRRDHIRGSTYLLFSSDNGLHSGEYRLLPGKLTAFDTDIHVPLIITGPHVRAAGSTDAITENIDLAETFTALAGADFTADGHSLLPLLRGPLPTDWRDAALIEHHGPDLYGGDPDFQLHGAGNPRTYEALRTQAFLYVEYDDGEREYYNLRTDPFELHNAIAKLASQTRARLHHDLARTEACHRAGCWRAMHLALLP